MSTSPSTGFPDAAATWNKRFAGSDYLFGKKPNRWLESHAGAFKPGSRVLCVADGEGRNSVWLARQGLQVEAFDISEVGVSKARSLAATQGAQVDYTVASCDDFAWTPDAYDGVAAIFIQFADPALRARIFQRIVDCLKPGGVLILQGYTPKQLTYRTGGPPQVEHLYTAAMLREAFPTLEISALTEYEAEVEEGTGHVGRSALIGMVAHKR